MGISKLDNAAVRDEIELPELEEGNPYLFGGTDTREERRIEGAATDCIWSMVGSDIG